MFIPERFKKQINTHLLGNMLDIDDYPLILAIMGRPGMGKTRQLRIHLEQLGVDVYFEEQNIHSLSTDGELMLTVLASYAQEESRSASENQKWRIKKNFEEGKPWSSTLLGYRNINGRYEIVPEEAETVRMIFDWYLEGMGATAIRNRLNAMGIKTRLGNRWSRSPILKLLRNYAYTGNLLLQRTYRENHITKKCIINHGEKPMYHAENTHEAIIDMDTFNQVQEEIRRRAEHFKHKEGAEMKTYPFTGLVRCACCGKNYVRSGAPAYRTWICRTRRREGLKNCGADIIPEDELFRLTAEVIGGEVTEDAVRDKITAVQARENRTLVFCLRNGKETVKRWKEHEAVHICTEEQKRQISLKNSGRKRTEEQRRQQSERMKEYWKTHTFTEEQRRNLSEKKKEYWNDREASDAHRQKLSRLMKEMRTGETSAGKEEQDG